MKRDTPNMLKLKQLQGKKTDKERWEWLFKNAPAGFMVMLDNDCTYIVSSEDEENEMDVVNFDHYIGNGPGIVLLLSLLGIRAEHV